MSLQPRDVGRVALVIGGDSAEREVSLMGGRAVADALGKLGVNHTVVDGPRALLDQVAAGQVERVFNMLHGRGGEDGALQGALRLYDVPCTGSGVLASALTMDKLQCKRIWAATGLPTPRWRIVTDGAMDAAMEPPVFVKPAREGSSVGMSRVLEAGQLEQAIRLALEYDRQVLIEELIDGPEYTAAILNGEVLPLIRIETPREFYDYTAKYEADDTEYHCPSGLDAAHERELQALCLRAFEVLGGHGWGRVDFLLDEAGKPWLIDVNTVPGMTGHSLVPMAARAAGMDFEELVWRILKTAS